MTKDSNRVVLLSDNETEVYIKDPSYQIREQAEFKKAKIFKEAIQNDVPTREKMLQIIREKNIWTNEQEVEASELQAELAELNQTLEEGGITLQQAKENAVRAIQLEATLTTVTSRKVEMLSNTADAQANNAEFNYLMAHCAVYNDDRKNKLFFKNYDDFLNRKNTTDGNLIAAKCAEILYGSIDLGDTPAKKFLQEYDLVNDKMQLVNDEGHLVDLDGRLVDEDGRFIKYVGKDKKKVFVDEDGKEIKPIKSKPFLDSNGKPIRLKKAPAAKSEQKTEEKQDQPADEK